jgi:hypothetical protein
MDWNDVQLGSAAKVCCFQSLFRTAKLGGVSTLPKSLQTKRRQKKKSRVA